MALLLLLTIYLAVILRPPIAVMGGLAILLSGTIAHVANMFFTADASLLLATAEQLLRAAGAGSFLWAVHLGIIKETYTDALTGVHNKRFFLDRLPQELERAARKQTPLSLAVLDLDHFKRYNDTLGHVEGDRLLQALASILTHHLRRYDLVCRWGGEEFALLLPDTDADTATAIAERLRQAVALAFGGPERRAPVTISVGVATFPLVQGTAEELVHAADTALYRAKQGRNRVAAWQVA